LVLLFLGANKQLDFQTLLTAVGREFFKSMGWYAVRRWAQSLFLVILSLFATLFLIWAFRQRKILSPCVKSACLGILVLALFILLRAALFCHAWEKIGIQAPPDWLKSILELGGIAWIGSAAIISCASKRGPSSLYKAGQGSEE
jgi:hypothetical protein